MQKKLFNIAKRYIPGGVNSPIRAFRAVGGEPVFVKEAHGSKIYGECGREFVDFCMSYGALILGHSHPEVVSAVKNAVEKGTSYGAPTVSETELAKIIVESVPSIELVRLTNSGAEAVIAAVKLARAFTKRQKIIKFKGCYHGFILDDCLEIEYNNLSAVAKNISACAGVIVEPVPANRGVVIPDRKFLEGLRELCAKYEAVLIFDEVVTGFRLGFSGAQGFFGVKPDLTCLGKIIGGGLPIGAFGGKRSLMELLAPKGDVYHAGTFCGNPVSVTAGLATLKILKRDNPYKELEKKTEKLCMGLEGATYIGSMFSFKISDFKRFYHNLLKDGIYLSPSELETNFVSTAHTDLTHLRCAIGAYGSDRASEMGSEGRMRILINGKGEDIEDGMSIAGILKKKNIRPEVVTVELNEQIINRAMYPEKVLKEGDKLEFVYYMGGGSASLTTGGSTLSE